jgi:hypothetical protein
VGGALDNHENPLKTIIKALSTKHLTMKIKVPFNK